MCDKGKKPVWSCYIPVEDDWCEILRKSPSQAVKKKKGPRRRSSVSLDTTRLLQPHSTIVVFTVTDSTTAGFTVTDSTIVGFTVIFSVRPHAAANRDTWPFSDSSSCMHTLFTWSVCSKRTAAWCRSVVACEEISVEGSIAFLMMVCAVEEP